MPAAGAQSFLFADIAGFTALTEAHGDEDAADLAERFTSDVLEVLPRHGAEHVKTIGDALMLRVALADNAVRLGLLIARDLMVRHGCPAVRVGMHHGSAVERSGDWFGATVNVAARVSSLATGNEVLLTAAAHEAAGRVEGVHFVERGLVRLRNVGEPVRLLAAERAGATTEGLPLDPVCRMAVDPSRCAGELRHDGVDYHFCSLECAGKFARSPATYAPGGHQVGA